MSRGAVWLAGAAVALGACLDSPVTRCADHVCPSNAVCSETHGCVVPDQLAACDGLGQGDSCTFSGAAGRCDDGACIVLSCGDQVRDDPEQCDGPDLGGATCDQNGFYGGGPPTCTSSCTLDLSTCTGRCGDGTVNGPEVCDDGQLTADCTDFGFYDTTGLACTAICTIDTSGCQRRCGDGTRDPEEECEGSDVGGADCTDLGFYQPGGLACDPFCRFDVAGCQERCGDGVINGEEVCDGEPPEGAYCVDFFFDRGHVTCSAGCAPGFDQCRRNGMADMAPPLDMATGVWGSASDRIYAVRGTEVYFFDGYTWLPVAATGGAGLTDIWGAPTGELFAVGSTGAVLRFDGSAWTEATVGTSVTLYAVWGSGADDVYAAGQSGQIHHYDGAAWSLADSSQTILYRDLWGTGPGDVFAVGDLGTIVHYDGSTWTVMASGTRQGLYGVGGSGPADVYAAGLSDTVLHYDGASWRPLPTTTSNIKRTVAASGPDDVFVSGVELRHYDGYTWWKMSSSYAVTASWSLGRGDVVAATTVPVRRYQELGWASDGGIGESIFGLDRRHIYAVGGTSLDQVRSFDGAAWTSHPNSEPATCSRNGLHDVWASAPDDVYAVGRCMAIVHYDGMTWTWTSDTADSGNGALLAVWGNSPTDLFAVGEVNSDDATTAIYHFDGSTWSRQTSGITSTLRDVWGSGPGDVFAVGDDGVILHYDGSGWSAQASGITQRLTTVWGFAADDVWAVGDAGHALHYDGTTWSTVDLGVLDNLSGVWGSGVDDVFISGSNGRLLHDDGLGFAPINAPVTLGRMWGGNGNVYFAGGSVLVRDVAASCAASEGSCTDTYDGDCDGATDCADADCAADPACETSESSCADRFDNDGDGRFDCGDPDCAGVCACAGAAPIVCGQTLTGTTVGGDAATTDYGCGGRSLSGPERVYAFVPSVNGSVTVTLTGMTADLDLVVVGQTATGECDPAGSCLKASQTAGDETATFTAVRGTTYYLHVDGYAGDAGDFTLTTTCW